MIRKLCGYALRVGFLLEKVYWWFVRPVTVGVVGLVVDQQGRVLLVRHTYKRGWYLPGGGIKRGESSSSALARELKEETGIAAQVGPDELVGGD